MCGFIGRISKAQEEQDLLRGLPWLRRRGPDSQRLWSSTDGGVSLYHARLSIVDKDAKAIQPLTDVESAVTVAFVGEIYNYLELKKQFPDFNFKTKSDTEVILAAYVTRGISGLSLLKGMFSLVIVDEKQKKVVLARDLIGKKPLFYCRWNNDFLFGTSLIPLVAVHRKPVNLNKEAISYFWQNAYINPRTSVFQDAYPILPGEVLELDWSGNILSKSSCEPEPLRVYAGESLPEVIKNINSLLTLAVKRRLSHNPRPTILLSGGIDSTVVTYFAKKLSEKDSAYSGFQTLSLASLIPLMNDEFYARFAAHRIKTPLQIVSLTKGRLEDEIIKTIDLQDEPLGMPSFFLIARLVKMMSSYSKILLTGDGGDEVFLGYGRSSDWYDAKGGLSTDKGYLNYGPKIPSWMSDYARRTVTDALVGHMLAKVDRASAEQAVEIRCPLLDWDLVSYCRSLPFEILTHGNRTKALLKDQLSGWPHWFLERPKLGFTYNLRWLWGLSGYKGLREVIDQRAIDTFAAYLPSVLQKKPINCKTRDIFQHFEVSWRLLTWSRFLMRLDSAQKI